MPATAAMARAFSRCGEAAGGPFAGGRQRRGSSQSNRQIAIRREQADEEEEPRPRRPSTAQRVGTNSEGGLQPLGEDESGGRKNLLEPHLPFPGSTA